MRLLRIKWENISATLFIVLATRFNIQIFAEEGFDLGIAGCEVVLMVIMATLIVVLGKIIRKTILFNL